MKMCLLEVAMFERFRSSHFQSEWVVKILRTAGEGGKGVKECYDWGDYFCWGGVVSTPLHAITFSNKS